MRVATARTLVIAALATAAIAIAVRAAVARTAANATPDFARAGALGLDGLRALDAAVADRTRALDIALGGMAAVVASGVARGHDVARPAELSVAAHPLVRTADGWTLSATVGADWSAAAREVSESTRTWRDGATVWSSGALIGDRRLLARVSWSAPSPAPDMAAAASGLVTLATTPAPSAQHALLPDALAAVAAVLLAIALGLVAHRRFDRPVTAALDALDRWREGTTSAMPTGLAGNASARAIAAAVASSVTECDRRVARVADAWDTDVHRVAMALAAMGEGDLALQLPEVCAPLAPIASAASGLRSATIARLTSLHETALAVARAGLDAREAERGLRASAASLDTSLTQLADGAIQAGDRVAVERSRVESSLEALAGAPETLRRAARELRAAIGDVARRGQELAVAADRLHGRADRAADLDEALDLLTSIATSADALVLAPGKSIPAPHVLATARRSRTALAELRREADTVVADVTAAARDLSRLAEASAPAVRDAPPAAIAVVRDVVGAHLGSAERLAEGLAQLAGAIRPLAATQAGRAAALARLDASVEPLATALLGWRLPAAVDTTWLAQPREPAPDVDVAAVVTRAGDARARLDDLLVVLESEADRALTRG